MYWCMPRLLHDACWEPVYYDGSPQDVDGGGAVTHVVH